VLKKRKRNIDDLEEQDNLDLVYYLEGTFYYINFIITIILIGITGRYESFIYDSNKDKLYSWDLAIIMPLFVIIIFGVYMVQYSFILIFNRNIFKDIHDSVILI
jgi:hypothetical protein